MVLMAVQPAVMNAVAEQPASVHTLHAHQQALWVIIHTTKVGGWFHTAI